MSKPEFDTVIEKPEGVITPYFAVPFSAHDVFGTKGQVKVRGTIDGIPYRNSIAPMGDGTHVMLINREIRDATGKDVGDSIHVVMELDTEERTVAIPDDFQTALSANQQAKAHFDGFSYSQRKLYVDWVMVAKKPETRARRIQDAVQRLSEGLKFQS